jgi:hypothetical protein
VFVDLRLERTGLEETGGGDHMATVSYTTLDLQISQTPRLKSRVDGTLSYWNKIGFKCKLFRIQNLTRLPLSRSGNTKR